MAFEIISVRRNRRTFTYYRVYLGAHSQLRIGRGVLELNLPHCADFKYFQTLFDKQTRQLGIKFVEKEIENCKQCYLKNPSHIRLVTLKPQLKSLGINQTKMKVIDDCSFEDDMLILNVDTLIKE
jgi:hypothetical protein